ncbi:Hypothetical predicted protein [Lecanosticta acicola]|uniref:NAD(P)-binding protein n=1 Tax=Lecanosticta acicola TaxID=111012 RepID=A0AAI8Z946_9PEZI|nr:Hypothetical predicted protein [Lecanosticta acicola]
MPTAVVTGANSGIGHAFAQLLINEIRLGTTDDSSSHRPQTLTWERNYNPYHVVYIVRGLDVRSPESINGLAAQLAGKPVDVLLNVAGVMAPTEEDALGSVTKDICTKTFETNTFGPLLLTQALLDSLLAAPTPHIGIVSSRVGSINDNSTGGSYAYRASKAAVNSIGKSLSVDLRDRGVVVSLLHPGIVKSNLNPHAEEHAEAVEPEEAAGKLWKVFMAHGIDDTGKFWHREGYELPW